MEEILYSKEDIEFIDSVCNRYGKDDMIDICLNRIKEGERKSEIKSKLLSLNRDNLNELKILIKKLDFLHGEIINLDKKIRSIVF